MSRGAGDTVMRAIVFGALALVALIVAYALYYGGPAPQIGHL